MTQNTKFIFQHKVNQVLFSLEILIVASWQLHDYRNNHEWLLSRLIKVCNDLVVGNVLTAMFTLTQFRERRFAKWKHLFPWGQVSLNRRWPAHSELGPLWPWCSANPCWELARPGGLYKPKCCFYLFFLFLSRRLSTASTGEEKNNKEMVNLSVFVNLGYF